MKLNEKILYYRKAAGMSQEELAERVGVSRQAVSKWELGDATPEVDKLLALARAFGVTADELLNGSEPAGPQEQTLPPREEERRVYAVPNAPAGDSFDKAAGLVGRLLRRYGWLAGVYIALGGLGTAIVGALARWGFGAMFAASGDVMDGMGGFGGFSGIGGVEFSPGTPPEVQEAILEQFGQTGQGPSLPVSPTGGIQDFVLGFAAVIIVIGVVVILTGAALAVYLYQKGNRND